MRKHDVRKWLHAILDLVPVILIPVFMVYSHRHSLTEQTTVDVQYKYQSNEVNSVDDLVVGNSYLFDFMYLSSTYNGDISGLNYNGVIFDFVPNFYYIDSNNDYHNEVIKVSDVDLCLVSTTAFSSTLRNTGNNLIKEFLIASSYNHDGLESTPRPVFMLGWYNIRSNSNEIYEQYRYSSYSNPVFIRFKCVVTIESNSLYLSDDIISCLSVVPDYLNTIDSVDVNDTSSSIMNVFLDNFNNSINKYFNFTNVFNFGDIYNFLNTNLFGGNAPTIMFSIYNILVYEFLIDMLFIIYGVFMFIIDFINRMMDEAFNRSHLGGGR